MEKRRKVFVFQLLLLLSFLVLAGRLFQLQVVGGGKNRELAEGNRIKVIKIPAPRGVIYDRQGRVLARNIPIFNCDREEALKLEAGGKEVETGIGREYPYGEVLAPVIGYLGEAAEGEIANYQIDKLSNCELKAGDLVGRTGVEQQYDCLLRGDDGGELVEVDAVGREVRKIGRKEPVLGKDLTLTVDAVLQKTAYEALGNKKGAAVVSFPATGEILTLVSSPSFDANLFEAAKWQSGKVSELGKILNDPRQPLFNRAISGVYPPGSTFKLITAAAGLEEGKIDKNFTIDDPGIIQIGPYRFGNWYFLSYGKKEGPVDLVKAIQRSTDTFFYKVGELVGIEKLAGWAGKFGLGKTLGIDLPSEAEGFVPDEAWKKKTKGEPWFLGDTYHLSIGQGDLLVTPLQMNNWTAAVANGGKVCQPYLTEVQSSKFKVQNEQCRDLGLKKETIELITEGMKKACEPGGTGWPFFNFKIPVACKTGTAEYGDPKGQTHAWFTVFGPAEKPEIVVTVLVEGGGEGASVAAPIAKKILEEWKVW